MREDNSTNTKGAMIDKEMESYASFKDTLMLNVKNKESILNDNEINLQEDVIFKQNP